MTRAHTDFGVGTVGKVDRLTDKSAQLYGVLQYLLEGEAFMIIRNTDKGNGLEGWRKLVKRRDPVSGAKKSAPLPWKAQAR